MKINNENKNRRLIKNLFEGTPQGKALSMRLLEHKLNRLDSLEDKIRDIKMSDKENSLKEIRVESLIYGIDGNIRFKGKLIKMRSQVKTLCILFMRKHKDLVDYSSIKDELIDAKKRSSTSFRTITKYVSELHNLLKKHFKKNVLFNQEKEGYIFDVTRTSRK